MNKLEVGMYVRTFCGKIYQITELDLQFEMTKQTCKKASHNIIDLIEEDDLIKCNFAEQILILQVGARYTTLHPENGFVKGVFTPDNEFWPLEMLVEEDILQSIVTKEQFKSMEYRLGE